MQSEQYKMTISQYSTLSEFHFEANVTLTASPLPRQTLKFGVLVVIAILNV